MGSAFWHLPANWALRHLELQQSGGEGEDRRGTKGIQGSAGGGPREREAHLGENLSRGRGALGELRLQGPSTCSTVPIGFHLQNIIWKIKLSIETSKQHLQSIKPKAWALSECWALDTALVTHSCTWPCILFTVNCWEGCTTSPVHQTEPLSLVWCLIYTDC